jgi:hypothetical protein
MHGACHLSLTRPSTLQTLHITAYARLMSPFFDSPFDTTHLLITLTHKQNITIALTTLTKQCTRRRRRDGKRARRRGYCDGGAPCQAGRHVQDVAKDDEHISLHLLRCFVCCLCVVPSCCCFETRYHAFAISALFHFISFHAISSHFIPLRRPIQQ